MSRITNQELFANGGLRTTNADDQKMLKISQNYFENKIENNIWQVLDFISILNGAEKREILEAGVKISVDGRFNVLTKHSFLTYKYRSIWGLLVVRT